MSSSTEPRSAESFATLDLIEPIQRALLFEKYHKPTPVQAKSIPFLLEGRDLLGCAQTGTGKTAAFALPILQLLNNLPKPLVPKLPRALILGPTRELVSQINESFQIYGRFLSLETTSIFGGVSMGAQVRAMRRGADIVVATPGRLLDLMRQDEIRLDALEFFVLDEADRMLDMGFLPDVKRIIARLPRKRQSAFFSATLPAPVIELAEVLLHKPAKVAITPPSTTVSRIEQKLIYLERTERPGALRDLVRLSAASRVMVFTRTKRGADQVAKRLRKEGIGAQEIHGGKTQATRERALRGFRAGAFPVLVATDLAARGLDVDGITHVVNYELPDEPESYVHRIGRTGRAGASGIAISFCGSEERDRLRAIQKSIGRNIPVSTMAAETAGQRSTAPRKPVAAVDASAMIDNDLDADVSAPHDDFADDVDAFNGPSEFNGPTKINGRSEIVRESTLNGAEPTSRRPRSRRGKSSRVATAAVVVQGRPTGIGQSGKASRGASGGRSSFGKRTRQRPSR